MPTDITMSNEERRAAAVRSAADLRAILLLVPLIMSLSTIALSMESPAFAAGLIGMETE